MGYRDELIERLQSEGFWDRMTVQDQERMRELSDSEAGQILVLEDQWTLGETEAVNVIGLASLIRMRHAFKGALVEREGEPAGRLTEAGRLLAEFVIELSNQGLTPDEIDEGLRELGPLVIAALITSYKLSPS